FLVIGRDQAFRRAARQHKRQFPDEIIDILDAAVAPARTERRNDMGAVTGKDDPAMHELFQPAALEGVDRDPIQLEIAMADDLLDPGDDVFRLLLLFRIGIGTELQVYTVDIIRLLVQQRRLPGMERRFEPEPAFRREIRLHLHISKQKPLLEDATLEVQPEHSAYRRASAVAGDKPRGLQFVSSVRRLDADARMISAQLYPGYLVFPSQIDQVGKIGGALDQILLDVILLQVDEGRHFVARLGQQVEAPDFAVAVEKPADLPGHAFFHHAVCNTQPVEYFQRAFRPADGAA